MEHVPASIEHTSSGEGFGNEGSRESETLVVGKEEAALTPTQQGILTNTQNVIIRRLLHLGAGEHSAERTDEIYSLLKKIARPLREWVEKNVGEEEPYDSEKHPQAAYHFLIEKHLIEPFHEKQQEPEEEKRGKRDGIV